MTQDSFQLELVRKQSLVSIDATDTQVVHLVFRRKDGARFDYQPGQFITFLLEDPDSSEDPLRVERRSYSLANAPDEGGSEELEIAVSKVTDENGNPGLATRLLFDLEPGQVLNAIGPKGRLVLPEEPCKRYIFIATGTGVTPYRAMLQKLKQQFAASADTEVILLFGVRESQELLYEKDFFSHEEEHDKNFSFYPCYSRCETLPADQPRACRGRVTQKLRELELREDDLFFLCGNPDMVDECFDYLKNEKEFSTKQIIREKYVSPKKRT